MSHSKNLKLFSTLTFVFFTTLFSTYFIYKDYSSTQAATEGFINLENTVAQEKSEYVPGEVIVKLKQPIAELDQNVISETNWKATAYQFKAINKARLPEKLLEVDRKYTVKSIEKVFPHKEAPQRELAKMKIRYAVQLKNGTRVIDEEKVLSNDMSTIYLMKVKPESSIKEIVQTLKSDPNVEYVEPNYLTKTTVVPNDPFYPLSTTAVNQWYLENPGGRTGFRADADIDASAAWDINSGTSSTVIAVTDSGIDYTHPDLGGGIGPTYKVIGGYDIRNQDADPMDDFGHGTHVAGIIAANYNNKTGVAGVCPKCRLLAVKSSNSSGVGTSTTGALAIDYAVSHGADIINVSWGSGSVLTTVQTAIQNAVANDVLVVAAAGNKNETKKFYPAAFPEALAVANTSYDDTKSPNSNYNSSTDKWIDISAPGTYILSTALKGGAICTSPHETGTARYGYCTGTSMAAPIVAGVAGLVLSKDTFINVKNLTFHLKATSDNINARNPQYSGLLGSGRVNANNALTVIPAFCVDSDNGLTYKTRGYIYGGGLTIKNYDRCATLDPTVINEGHCGPQNQSWFSAYKCPLGCKLGRCLQQCVTNIASPNTIAMTGTTSTNGSTYHINAGSSTMTWPAVSGSAGYFVEIDWLGNGWATCDTPNWGDICLEVSTPSAVHSFLYGTTDTRVKFYSKNSSGAFTCTPKTITVDINP